MEFANSASRVADASDDSSILGAKGERLNILVLHRLGDPAKARRAIRRHTFALHDHAPHNNYLYHDVHIPPPNWLKDIRFHGIVLDTTLLCMRWFPPKVFQKVRKDYAFVATSDAFKIALPQDDYDHSVVLDSWLCDWRVDLTYTVCSDHWDILYPNFIRQGKLVLGLTGYLDDELLGQRDSAPQAFSRRPIDLGYRATRLPAVFGRVGEVKSSIGEQFLVQMAAYGFRCDVSNRPEDTIVGDKWLEFMNSCKFTLGSNSGSSLWDPHGEIGRRVRRYSGSHPNASFDEVERACFPGLDGKYVFTAVSPRVFEAGLMKSGQVLTTGPYSGIVRPWEHYIPLEPDFSNRAEVASAMRDQGFAERMIEACYEMLVETPALRYSHFAATMLREIAAGSALKHVSATPLGRMADYLARYEAEVRPLSQRFWQPPVSERIRKHVMSTAPRAYARSRMLKVGIRRFLNGAGLRN